MSTATLTRPAVTEDISTEDEAAPSCQMFDASTGENCDRPAAAWIEFHRVGDCNSTECNAKGNMEGNVCTDHLDWLIELAVETLEAATPPGGMTMSLFGFPTQVRLICATCHLPLNKASDILQKVIRK